MSDEAKYLVMKDGYFYRPNAQGYTLYKFDAGRFTKEDAEKHAAVEPWHMAAVHEDDVPDEREPDKFISGLHVEISELKRQLATAQKVDEQQTADFIKDKAEIARLRKALEAARDDFELIEQRVDEGQARRAGETAHQGRKEALLVLEVEVEARKAIGPVDAYVGIPDNG